MQRRKRKRGQRDELVRRPASGTFWNFLERLKEHEVLSLECMERRRLTCPDFEQRQCCVGLGVGGPEKPCGGGEGRAEAGSPAARLLEGSPLAGARAAPSWPSRAAGLRGRRGEAASLPGPHLQGGPCPGPLPSLPGPTVVSTPGARLPTKGGATRKDAPGLSSYRAGEVQLHRKLAFCARC